MNRILKGLAVTSAVFACATTPALAEDDDYTTDEVRPSWTAASAESCADPDTAPLLSAFKDNSFYAAAPGGAFEDGAEGWLLDGGAALTTTDVASQVFGTGSGALDLPVGASATSPTFCVDERYPHFRFSYASASPDDDAGVRVEVLYPGLVKDNVRKAEDLKVKHGRAWGLTNRIKLKPDHGLKRGGWRLVAIRLTATGKPGARVTVDDVLVDPKARA
jgi:hypothetical protein